MSNRTAVVLSLAALVASSSLLIERFIPDSSVPTSPQVDSGPNPPPVPTSYAGSGTQPSATTSPVLLHGMLDRTLYLSTDTEASLLLRLEPNPEVTHTRLPMALTLAIDVSGSMQGVAIHNARSAALELVDALQEGDQLTVVTYSSTARTLLANTVIGRDREPVRNVLRTLQADGSTCISCAFEELETHARTVSSEFAHRMVLLSDGQPTTGVTDARALVTMAEGIRQTGATMTSIGVGLRYDGDLMRAIADAGVGSYYFVSDSGALDDVLGREIALLQNALLPNARVQVRLPAGWSVAAVDVPGLDRSKSVIELDLGLVSRDTRSIVLPLVRPVGASSGTMEVALIADGQAEPLVVLAPEFGVAETRADSDATLRRDVVEAAELVRSAREVDLAMRDNAFGNTAAARERLLQNQMRLEAIEDSLDLPSLGQEARLLEGASEALAAPMGEEEVRGLELQNAARARERAAGAAPAAAFHSGILVH